jgi:hypothetical protein
MAAFGIAAATVHRLAVRFRRRPERGRFASAAVSFFWLAGLDERTADFEPRPTLDLVPKAKACWPME